MGQYYLVFRTNQLGYSSSKARTLITQASRHSRRRDTLLIFCPTCVEGYDYGTLRRFIGIFPNLPLTRLLQGYFNYMHLPIGIDDPDNDESLDALPESNDWFSSVLVRRTDLLLCLVFHYPLQDAFGDLPHSVLAHRILSELYQIEGDYENVIKAAEGGLKLVKKMQASYGKQLPRKESIAQCVFYG